MTTTAPPTAHETAPDEHVPTKPVTGQTSNVGEPKEGEGGAAHEGGEPSEGKTSVEHWDLELAFIQMLSPTLYDLCKRQIAGKKKEKPGGEAEDERSQQAHEDAEDREGTGKGAEDGVKDAAKEAGNKSIERGAAIQKREKAADAFDAARAREADAQKRRDGADSELEKANEHAAKKQGEADAAAKELEDAEARRTAAIAKNDKARKEVQDATDALRAASGKEKPEEGEVARANARLEAAKTGLAGAVDAQKAADADVQKGRGRRDATEKEAEEAKTDQAKAKAEAEKSQDELKEAREKTEESQKDLNKECVEQLDADQEAARTRKELKEKREAAEKLKKRLAAQSVCDGIELILEALQPAADGSFQVDGWKFFDGVALIAETAAEDEKVVKEFDETLDAFGAESKKDVQKIVELFQKLFRKGSGATTPAPTTATPATTPTTAAAGTTTPPSAAGGDVSRWKEVAYGIGDMVLGALYIWLAAKTLEKNLEKQEAGRASGGPGTLLVRGGVRLVKAFWHFFSAYHVKSANAKVVGERKDRIAAWGALFDQLVKAIFTTREVYSHEPAGTWTVAIAQKEKPFDFNWTLELAKPEGGGEGPLTATLKASGASLQGGVREDTIATGTATPKKTEKNEEAIDLALTGRPSATLKLPDTLALTLATGAFAPSIHFEFEENHTTLGTKEKVRFLASNGAPEQVVELNKKHDLADALRVGMEWAKLVPKVFEVLPAKVKEPIQADIKKAGDAIKAHLPEWVKEHLDVAFEYPDKQSPPDGADKDLFLSVKVKAEKIPLFDSLTAAWNLSNWVRWEYWERADLPSPFTPVLFCCMLKIPKIDLKVGAEIEYFTKEQWEALRKKQGEKYGFIEDLLHKIPVVGEKYELTMTPPIFRIGDPTKVPEPELPEVEVPLAIYVENAFEHRVQWKITLRLIITADAIGDLVPELRLMLLAFEAGCIMGTYLRNFLMNFQAWRDFEEAFSNDVADILTGGEYQIQQAIRGLQAGAQKMAYAGVLTDHELRIFNAKAEQIVHRLRNHPLDVQSHDREMQLRLLRASPIMPGDSTVHGTPTQENVPTPAEALIYRYLWGDKDVIGMAPAAFHAAYIAANPNVSTLRKALYSGMLFAEPNGVASSIRATNSTQLAASALTPEEKSAPMSAAAVYAAGGAAGALLGARMDELRASRERKLADKLEVTHFTNGVFLENNYDDAKFFRCFCYVMQQPWQYHRSFEIVSPDRTAPDVPNANRCKLRVYNTTRNRLKVEIWHWTSKWHDDNPLWQYEAGPLDDADQPCVLAYADEQPGLAPKLLAAANKPDPRRAVIYAVVTDTVTGEKWSSKDNVVMDGLDKRENAWFCTFDDTGAVIAAHQYRGEDRS
jgi:hypothetical protein